MADLLREAQAHPQHLGLTKSGQPKHPLYIGYAVQPVDWVLGYLASTNPI